MIVTKLTQPCLDIYKDFQSSGQDFDCHLGKIAKGEVDSSISRIIYYAQLFSNKDFRGALVSSTAFSSAYNRRQTLTGIDGLNYDRFTSHVVVDKSEDLGDLQETLLNANGKFSPFYRTKITTAFPNLVAIIQEVARNIIVEPAGRFGLRREKTLTLTEKQTNNTVCSIVDKIYQVAYAKLKNSGFKTNLERVTAAIFATLLVTRAMNFSNPDMENCEQRLNEALKVSFCTHLNGCHSIGSQDITKIIKDGAEVGIQLIGEMKFDKSDVKQKYERLGTPLKNEPKDLQDALFGEKSIDNVLVMMSDDPVIVREHDRVGFSAVADSDEISVDDIIDDPIADSDEISVVDIIDDPIDDSAELPIADSAELPVDDPIDDSAELPVVDSIDDSAELPVVDSIDDSAELPVVDSADPNDAITPAIIVGGASDGASKRLGDGKRVVELGSGEGVVPEGARIVGDGEDVHKKGNAVNYRTLKTKVLQTIDGIIDRRAKECAIRAEKKSDLNAVSEINYLSGARDGVKGLCKKSGKTPAYNAGYQVGESFHNKLVGEIDKLYSEDKKTLMVPVCGKGAEITKKLAGDVASNLGFGTFGELVKDVQSTLSKAFQKFKDKTEETTK